MERKVYKNNFYKYVNLDAAKLILENGTLQFSSPTEFNDPFDISVQNLFGYDLEKGHQEHVEKFANLAFSKKEIPPGNGKELANYLLAIRRSMASVKDEDLLKIRQEYIEKHKHNVRVPPSVAVALGIFQMMYLAEGVFCATKRPDNYLLWAHYSDKHKGACLGFKPNVEKDSQFTLLDDVIYSDVRPHLYETPSDFVHKTLFSKDIDVLRAYNQKLTMTKSVKWAYEEELRFTVAAEIKILKGEKFSFREYHDEELVEVYLGCKMNAGEKSDLIAAAKKRNPNVSVFHTTPRPNTFELYIEKLDI